MIFIIMIFFIVFLFFVALCVDREIEPLFLVIAIILAFFTGIFMKEDLNKDQKIKDGYGKYVINEKTGEKFVVWYELIPNTNNIVERN